MRITEFCIKRPIFTLVINILLLIVGYISFDRLSVRELPKTEQFTISISTYYRGASADLVEKQITIPIENRISTVEGVQAIQSQSRAGSSSVVITFKANYDIKEGMNDVRDQLSRVRRSLPDEADEPILSKSDPNVSPTLFISFSDEHRNALALTDYVDRYIKPELEQVEGVGSVFIYGARRYAVRIWPDPLQMAARQVTVNDINHLLISQNTALPSGDIRSTFRNFTINPDTKLKDVEEFRNLIIRDEDGKRVRLSDVAEVSIGARDKDSAVRVNGKSAVVVAIVPQTTANPVEVSDDVRARMMQFEKALPDGMQMNISYDSAIFIKASIHEVYKTIFEAIVLVVLVVFAFLGSMRSSTIPIVTIPLCLLASFGLIYFMGYTINTMTLLALVLAIGLVVDDAIVMLENVHRHIERGEKPFHAAIKGSGEITFAIIAMTLTLAAVYAPIGFTQGFTGDIFREFAFTLAGAVVISGFVALTLSPMMCAYVLTDKSHDNAYVVALERFIERVNRHYRSVLDFLLHRRAIVVVGFIILAALGGWLFKSLKLELAPNEDQGSVVSFVTAPTGSSFKYTDEQVRQLEAILLEVPERNALVAVTGSGGTNSGMAFMSLKDWNDRDRSQAQIIKSIMPQLFRIPGAQVIAFDMPPIRGGGGGSTPVDMVVQLSGTYQELYEVMENFKQALSDYPGVVSVQSDLKMDSAQIDIIMNREMAADLNIDLNDINDALNILFAGRHITDFESGGENYDVVVQMRESLRADPDQLNDIHLRAGNGEMVPLSSLIEIKPTIKPDSLPHYNRMRSSHLTANLAPGYSLGDVIKALEAKANEQLPANAKYTWAGFSLDFINSSGAMLATVLLALVFIYLVLSAQFESFIDPFIIMLTVPFSIIGAVLMLKLTGGTNNIYTQIGFVTLIGLITKHGILITDFANKLQAEGRGKVDAVIEAAVIRLRPILMTTGAMVLGAIPLALASGPGAAARSQMGWVIVGGMLLGTFFSLIVVPTAYTFFARDRQKQRVV